MQETVGSFISHSGHRMSRYYFGLVRDLSVGMSQVMFPSNYYS